MEYLDTTINMRQDLYEYLDFLHKETGMKKKDIVLFVLQMFWRNQSISETMFNNNRYQAEYHKWKKFHICFNKVEREISFDLRKMHKFSLSFIVAYALRKYGAILLGATSEEEIFLNNYTYNSYEFRSVTDKCSKTLTMIWKIEEKIQKE